GNTPGSRCTARTAVLCGNCSPPPDTPQGSLDTHRARRCRRVRTHAPAERIRLSPFYVPAVRALIGTVVVAVPGILPVSVRTSFLQQVAQGFKLFFFSMTLHDFLFLSSQLIHLH